MSEDNQEQPPIDAEPPPEEAFALVGHEIRTEIIEVLAPEHELSLSELRSRLDADVDPSQLHYHLQRLVGHFVDKTERGYQLNSVGTRLSWTLRAGGLDRREEHVTIDANFECHYCQVPVEAIFTNGIARMVCPGCEYLYIKDNYILPLDALDDEAAAFTQFSQYLVLKMLFLSHNVCPNCTNHLSPTFESPKVDHNRKVVVNKSCELCGALWVQSVGMALLADPVFLSFSFDHGINVLSTPHWELEFAATDEHVTVRSTDPWEVALGVTFDDKTLELVVDGDMNVVERNWFDEPNSKGVVLPDKGTCLQVLRKHRWPEAVTCLLCDSPDTVMKGTTSKGAQRYLCNNCNSTFNDLTDTIFADHHLSLPEMVYIIRKMDETKTSNIAMHLDRSYPAVLSFVHKVQDSSIEERELDIVSTFEDESIYQASLTESHRNANGEDG